MTSKEMLNGLNSFVENVASVEECRRLLSDYSKTIDGFVIFGANQSGIRLNRTLEKHGYRVLCFADDILSLDNLDGKKVIHNLVEIKKSYNKVCFIISSTVSGSVRKMRKKLDDFIIDPAILSQEVITYIDATDSLTSSMPIYLNSIFMTVTNICTLNCKGCCTSTPFIPKPLKKHLQIELLQADIDALARIVDGVNSFTLTGGEPFLHPDISELLIYIRKVINPGQLSIPTNGTVLVNERTLQIIKDTGTIIRVDNYGSISGKLQELIEGLEKHSITYFVQESYSFPWTDFEDFYDRGGTGYEQFHNCRDWPSYTLYKKRLYPCFSLSRMDERGICEMSEEEFIDIYAGDVIKEKRKFEKFNKRNKPLSACKYCGITKNMIKAAMQLPRTE